MQALNLTASNGSKPTLTVTSVPKPTLQPNTAIVKIHAASINPSDILNANGGFSNTTFPRIPGRDYSGTVVDGPIDLVGKDVYGTSGSSLGFSADGTHAEFCVVPLDAIAEKPSNLSFAQAASIGVPFTTAALTLRRAMVQPTDVVLVLGATGAVGSAACQLAKARGCRVLTAARRDTADVNLVADPEMEAAKRLTDGRGPDVVIDAVGAPAVMKAALMCMAPRGRLAYISAPKSGSTDFVFDMKHVYREEKLIVGCNSLSADVSKTAVELRDMKKDFESYKLQGPAEDAMTTICLEDAVAAYEAMGHGQAKKYVITFE